MGDFQAAIVEVTVPTLARTASPSPVLLAEGVHTHRVTRQNITILAYLTRMASISTSGILAQVGNQGESRQTLETSVTVLSRAPRNPLDTALTRFEAIVFRAHIAGWVLDTSTVGWVDCRAQVSGLVVEGLVCAFCAFADLACEAVDISADVGVCLVHEPLHAFYAFVILEGLAVHVHASPIAYFVASLASHTDLGRSIIGTTVWNFSQADPSLKHIPLQTLDTRASTLSSLAVLNQSIAPA